MFLNCRAQSVRRTSLRDKTLTTKKDAVEEARLRLQAQEVFVVAPDSTTMDTHIFNDNESQPVDWVSKSSTSTNYNNNSLKTNHNHKYSHDNSLTADAVDSTILSTSFDKSHPQHSYQPRRPPEGRENDESHILAFNANGEHSFTDGTMDTAAVAALVATNTKQTEALQIQSNSKDATNGKINVQVTVLVGKYDPIMCSKFRFIFKLSLQLLFFIR